MKHSNICIKCDSIDVVKISGGDRWLKGYFNIIKVTSMKEVLVTRFLCLNCGYSEEWVESEKDLELISKNYKEKGNNSKFV